MTRSVLLQGISDILLGSDHRGMAKSVQHDKSQLYHLFQRVFARSPDRSKLFLKIDLISGRSLEDKIISPLTSTEYKPLHI